MAPLTYRVYGVRFVHYHSQPIQNGGHSGRLSASHFRVANKNLHLQRLLFKKVTFGRSSNDDLVPVSRIDFQAGLLASKYVLQQCTHLFKIFRDYVRTDAAKSLVHRGQLQINLRNLKYRV